MKGGLPDRRDGRRGRRSKRGSGGAVELRGGGGMGWLGALPCREGRAACFLAGPRLPTGQLKGTGMSLSIVHSAVTLCETVIGLQNGHYPAGPEPQRPSPTDVTLPRRLSGTKLKSFGRQMAHEHPPEASRVLTQLKRDKGKL